MWTHKIPSIGRVFYRAQQITLCVCARWVVDFHRSTQTIEFDAHFQLSNRNRDPHLRKINQIIKRTEKQSNETKLMCREITFFNRHVAIMPIKMYWCCVWCLYKLKERVTKRIYIHMCTIHILTSMYTLTLARTVRTPCIVVCLFRETNRWSARTNEQRQQQKNNNNKKINNDHRQQEKWRRGKISKTIKRNMAYSPIVK